MVLLSHARRARPVCDFVRPFRRTTGEPMTDATASTLFRRMQARRWLDVRAAPRDTRVRLTPAGIAAYDRARDEARRIAA